MHEVSIGVFNLLPQIWDALPLSVKVAIVAFLVLVGGIHSLSGDVIAVLQQLQEFLARRRPHERRPKRHPHP